MIREFAMPPSPALARRLIQMAKVTKISIDEATVTLATKDLITQNEIVFLGCPEVNLPIVQNIVDYGFRSVVFSTSFDNYKVISDTNILLTAAALAKFKEIVVFTHCPDKWHCHASMTYGMKFHFPLSTFLGRGLGVEIKSFAIYEDIMGLTEKALLIIEDGAASYRAEGLENEFPNTVFYNKFKSKSIDYCLLDNLVRRLYPNAPSRLINVEYRRGLRDRGYKCREYSSLFPFFNIIDLNKFE